MEVTQAPATGSDAGTGAPAVSNPEGTELTELPEHTDPAEGAARPQPTERLYPTTGEIRSGWAFLRAFPGRAARLIARLWHLERTRLLIMLAAALVAAGLLAWLGAGRTEIWDILITVALGALVVALSRDHRTAGSVIITMLGLSLIGTLAGPRWSPVTFDSSMIPATRNTQIGGEVATAPVGTYEVKAERVTIAASDGTPTVGLLRRPEGAPELTPGVIFMHGAGTHDEQGFEEQAESLASAGVATLVPDKPTAQYTLTSRDYVAMAGEYRRWFDYLRALPGINAAGVGVYAESEGCYPGFVLAGSDEDVSFLVLASAPVVMLREQATYATATYLMQVGVPRQLFTAASRLLGARQLPGESFEYADFDPQPYAEKVRAPILMMYGTADASMPVVQGPLTVKGWIAQAGNTALTVRYYAGANHGLKLGHSTDGALAPGVARDLARWVAGLPVTAYAAPSVAGATAVQDFMATTPGKTRWYASGDLMLTSLIAGVALLGLALLGWVAGQAPRLVGRRGLHLPDPIGRWSAGVGLAVLASWVLYLAYLAAVASLALHYESNPWISYGGWLVAQAMALVTTVLVVKLAARVWLMRGHERRGRDSGGRWLTLPAAGVLAATAAGTVILLVDLAYWGLFPLLS